MTSSIVKTTHFKKTAPAELMKILLEEGYGTEASTELNKPFGKVFKASNIALPEKKDGPGIIVQSIRDPDWKTDADSTLIYQVENDGAFGCKLTVVHSSIPEQANMTTLEEGWAKHLEQMQKTQDEVSGKKKQKTIPVVSMEHVEIPIKDMEKQKTFYEDVMGWTVGTMPGFDDSKFRFWTNDHQRSARGALNGEIKIPVPYVTSKDMDDLLERIVKAGGQVSQPKTPVQEFGFTALFKDPEGNELGIWMDA